MNSIRTMIVVTVLAAVGYGLYVSLHKSPPAPPPAGAEGQELTEAPLVQLPPEPGPPGVGLPPAPDMGAEMAPPYEPAPAASSAESTGAPETPQFADEAPPYAAEALPSAEQAAPYPAEPAYDATAAAYAGEAAIPAGSEPLSTEPAAAWQGEATGGAEYQTLLDAINGLLDANRLADAQLELSRWYDDPRLAPEEQTAVLQLLDQLTGTVIYSTEHYLEPPYEVQPGDSIDRIAERYQVPWQLLAKINGVSDPSQLAVGQQLKVLQGPFSAYIELNKHRLTLWLNGRYAGRFTIGTGLDQMMPEGELVVLDKQENPAYQGSDVIFDANDPNNPLGERWIDLGNHFGIHGTNDLSAVGQDTARGCIRLSPTDVEDVYDSLVAGSRIMIRR